VEQEIFVAAAGGPLEALVDGIDVGLLEEPDPWALLPDDLLRAEEGSSHPGLVEALTLLVDRRSTSGLEYRVRLTAPEWKWSPISWSGSP
jgi:hypothetical protein